MREVSRYVHVVPTVKIFFCLCNLSLSNFSQLDQAAFTLGSPSHHKKHLNGTAADGAAAAAATTTAATAKSLSPRSRRERRKELHSSGEELFRPSSKLSSSLLGEESPSMADLSSNNTPETQHRARRATRKR